MYEYEYKKYHISSTSYACNIRVYSTLFPWYIDYSYGEFLDIDEPDASDAASLDAAMQNTLSAYCCHRRSSTHTARGIISKTMLPRTYATLDCFTKLSNEMSSHINMELRPRNDIISEPVRTLIFLSCHRARSSIIASPMSSMLPSAFPRR